MNAVKNIAVISSTTALLTGCAAMSNTADYIATNTGKVVGAAVGATVGAALCAANDSDNVAACAVAGGIVGFSLGALWEQRQKALEEAAQKHNMDVKTEVLDTNNSKYIAAPAGESVAEKKKDNAMSTELNNTAGLFKSGSTTLNKDSEKALEDIAQAYKEANKKILIIGHTDGSGPAEYNQKLSKQRAQAVAQVFVDAGIPHEDIYYQGVGESRPIASNDTAEGRKKNRRVQIVEADTEGSMVAYNIAQTRSKDNLLYSSASEKDLSKEQAKNRKLNQPLVDFDGKPVQEADLDFYASVIPYKQSSGFSMFNKAYASDNDIENPAPVACYVDAPRITGEIIQANGEILNQSKYQIKDYVPGLAKSSVMAEVNGHVVGITPVAVLKKSYAPSTNPELLVYPEYKNNDKPEYKYRTLVNTYEGEDNFIYRIFVTGENTAIDCIDLVYKKSGGRSPVAGAIYYQADGEYSAQYKPARL